MALIKIQSYSLLGAIQDNKTVLGGSAGSGGGTGDPPAGFVGQLTQSNVTFDTAGSSRACSAGSAGSSSLVDNLDAIRLGLEICDDAIGDRHIDWGHGAEQVDAEDVPVSSGSFTATNVHDALEEVLGEGGGGLPANAQGSIVRGGVADWEAHVAKTDHFILVGDGADVVSKAFDWDDMAAGAGADMVHDHSTAGEGGEVPLASLGSYGQGAIMIGGGADWQALAIGTDHQLLKVNIGATAPAWASFVWNQIGSAAGADMVHDHSVNSEGGTHWGGQTQTYGGGSGINKITLPDNLTQGLLVVDDGVAAPAAIEYIRVVTTNAGPSQAVVFNDGGVDVDFRVEAVGHTDALVVQGSDGQITLGALGAGVVQSSAGGVLSSGVLTAYVEIAGDTMTSTLVIDVSTDVTGLYINNETGGADQIVLDGYEYAYINFLLDPDHPSAVGGLIMSDDDTYALGGLRYQFGTSKWQFWGGSVGIGTGVAAGKLHVDQISSTGGIPVLYLDQGDDDEPFTNYVGTSAASAAWSISSWTTGNAVQGHIQIDVNGTKRWFRFYDDPTS